MGIGMGMGCKMGYKADDVCEMDIVKERFVSRDVHGKSVERPIYRFCLHV